MRKNCNGSYIADWELHILLLDELQFDDSISIGRFNFHCEWCALQHVRKKGERLKIPFRNQLEFFDRNSSAAFGAIIHMNELEVNSDVPVRLFARTRQTAQ